MERITIYPKNKKQKSLLKALLEELNIRFEEGEEDNNALLSKDEFYSKIDNSIKQVEKGKSKILPKNKQKELLGL